jgi:hypothetical protein
VIATVVLAACSRAAAPSPSASPSPKTREIRGVVSLHSDSVSPSIWQGTCTPDCAPMNHSEIMAQECEGADSYSNVAGGAPVVVKDTASEVIGTGQLSPGHLVDTGAKAPIGGLMIPVRDCQFSFSLDVTESTVYRVEVANQPAQVFSRQDTIGGMTMTIGP